MSKQYKCINSKKSSRFICLKCMRENKVLVGLQRVHGQRERGHVKNAMCINPGCNGEDTKNLEVRWCDTYNEMYEYALKIRDKYYPEKGE